MASYTTDQESFWAGEFGTDYISRNIDNKQNIAHRTGRWANILQHITQPLTSILELGANIGINIDALNILQPTVQCSAVEINAEAVKILQTKKTEVFHESILTFEPKQQWDLVFTSGVLIHINPDALPKVYDLMARSTKHYVCINEYYNPTPVEVVYREHKDKLFKRDFAGEFMKAHPEFILKKYGFVYHGDPCFPADDSTWFLLEKK